MHALYDPPLDRWINGFLDRWLATDQRIAPVSKGVPVLQTVFATVAD
jgi:hypothetical protein